MRAARHSSSLTKFTRARAGSLFLLPRCLSEAAGRMGGTTKRSKLQLLYDLAQKTFTEHGDYPSPTQVDVLKLALSSVPLAELGIEHKEDCACAEDSCPGRLQHGESCEPPFNPDLPFTGQRPSITYLHIHEDEHLSLGIFCLPANAQIPLHNHPGMTVLSRVLFGKMHVRSFDWANGEQQQQQQQGNAGDEASMGRRTTTRRARRVLNRVLSAADEPAVLFPSSGGNIHQFTAVTDCAVLDLLSPPYSTDEGRDCIYYQEVTEGGETLLAEHEPPAEFAIDSGTYRGLPIRTRPYLLRSILAAAAKAAASGSPPLTSPTSSGQPADLHSRSEAAAGPSGDRNSGSGEVSSSSAAATNGSTSPQLGDLTLSGAATQPLSSKGLSGGSAAKGRRGGKKAVRRRSNS